MWTSDSAIRSKTRVCGEARCSPTFCNLFKAQSVTHLRRDQTHLRSSSVPNAWITQVTSPAALRSIIQPQVCFSCREMKSWSQLLSVRLPPTACHQSDGLSTNWADGPQNYGLTRLERDALSRRMICCLLFHLLELEKENKEYQRGEGTVYERSSYANN